tara:strand:- start:3653 stop:4351 length:699 start_codon:yes stop_codon:yes gene_type:complete
MEAQTISYLVVTIKEWNIKRYNLARGNFSGEWYLITNPSELSLEKVRKINPKYIFFPHWSERVPSEITSNYECICFHETDLPFGRGGSPIQNLIVRGFKSTKISAIKMTDKIDAGPIYLKKELSLEGIAEEIYIRSSEIVFEMIKYIIENKPNPIHQEGEVVIFKRRKPDQSIIPKEITTINELFDFIRMLDAEGYPKAKITFNSFEMEICNPVLRHNKLEGIVQIKPKPNS